ncbi:hypothetical protein DH2020_006436 [Rehmannia glutinosa]|uniref:Anthocyanidin 3-O-glucosyltransferase n=1 Tax=Rehmannia glutinosa TaxID=99300 RepID=A0ABR0XIU9_REHGL
MAFHSHIGVLAFPFGTHAVPLLTLVRRLAASALGFQFSFFNSATSNGTIFNERVLEPCENIRVYDVWDGTPEGRVFSGSHFEAVGLFLKASPGNFEKVIEEAEREIGLKICCLISDAFLWFACDLAEKRGVPWVPFWTAASCSLSAHIYTDEILKALGSKEIDPIITKDLKSKFHHFLNIGPSILSSPTRQPRRQNRVPVVAGKPKQAKSVVYISFGTVITPPENELVALAEALKPVRPFFGDQKLNSRMVEDSWKIGVKVKDGIFTKSETIDALNCVMWSEAGNVMRKMFIS